MSYEELLEVMKIKYFEICGHHVVGASETGIRLQVIADAIVKVKDKLILEQKDASLLTATGEALNKFGEKLGFARDSKKSAGIVRIFKNPEIQAELTIPESTWLTLPGVCDLKFETIEEVKIEKEKNFADVKVQAEKESEDYNLHASTELELYEEIEGIVNIVNVTDFEGGYALETDQSYRTRMITAFKEWIKAREES